MTNRIPPRALDPSGAANGDVPTYDAALGYVTWAASSAGGGTPAYDYSNASASGVVTISATPSTTETVITGMDATAMTAGVVADVTIDLWEAMSQSGATKGSVARLRDGGPGGTVIASHTFTDAGDSTAGHQQEWSYSATVTPVTDRLCVTIQATSGTPQITSDTRTFIVHQAAVSGSSLDSLNDVDVSTTPPANGDALVYDATAALWVPGAMTGGGSGSGYQPGSADEPPALANAKDDEFDGTSSVTWTTTPTAPNATNRNTTRPHHLYIKASGSGGAYVGRYQPVPASYPYTITSKLAGTTGRANYHRGGGIILAPATPTSTSNILYAGSVHVSERVAQRIIAQFGGSFGSESAKSMFGHWGSLYLKVTVASATSVSFYASADGWAWMPVETGFNPGFTPAFMGLAINEEVAVGGVEAFFDYFRVT